jgi:hypothetical protein
MAGIVFLGVLGATGLVLWIIATVLIVRDRAGGSGGLRVQGEIFAHGDYASRGGQLMRYARYRAVVPDGRTLECSSTSAGTWSPPPIGTRVTLLYVPGNPEQPLREAGMSSGTVVASLVLYGVGLLLVALAVVAGVAAASTDDAPARPVTSPRAPPHGHAR